MRIYMMERFLERLAQSEYRDNFIIKGGILVTANISVDSICRDDLYDWAEHVLKPAALEADEGNGEFHAGHWCRFCKARHICRERAKKNLELAAYEFAAPPLLSDEEIVEILEKVDSLLRWANDVKGYALQEAVAGKKWDGYSCAELYG